MSGIKAAFLGEVIRDMKKGVYDFTINGKCSSCGACCSNFLPVSEREIARIKKYIAKNNIQQQVHFLPSKHPVADFTCPFRDNGSMKCVIYEVRPAICKDFRCDKSKKNILPNKALYDRHMRTVKMTDIFFGGESCTHTITE